ncbi:MAG: hypothetical protein HZC05_01775 [Candidatus Magasanikbacteria bacterium]|nr:hypothetical protein [Candidatus Magasanikbacteria bacterium]
MSDNSIVILLKTKRTVFSTKDLAMLWKIDDLNYLKVKVYRLVKSGALKRIKKGFFAFDDNYNVWELANKLCSPSYVSLRTVLAASGVIFQYDSTIYSIAKNSRVVTVGKQKFVYQKIKNEVLFNITGLKITNDCTSAVLERAILDTLYLQKDCYFDNIRPINWDMCFEFVKIYQNKKLENRLQNLYQTYVK